MKFTIGMDLRALNTALDQPDVGAAWNREFGERSHEMIRGWII
ncbi:MULTISPECIES: hypothetical protein [Paraburkholderia]|jgi:hypothetical protein|uniref:Uncharacterized protein n=1 Tax=Paraburkholderia fungorum TaxID=134537 RepID=A0AAP5UY43_9BURK|nr:hypothetical protein [Paraburkholderia fungorum]MDT8843675.1 hypothetical protein [Paraburkholderia fungorum]